MRLRRATVRRQKVKANLIAAYRHLIRTVPLWDLTVEAITNHAGVSRSLFYLLWPDLPALIGDEYSEAVDRVVLYVTDLPPLHDEHVPDAARRKRVRAWINGILEITARQADVIAPAVALARLNKSLNDLVQQKRATYLNVWRSKLPPEQQDLAPYLSAVARAVFLDVAHTPGAVAVVEDLWMYLLYSRCPLCRAANATLARHPARPGPSAPSRRRRKM